ncbi:hypothetical protein PILCRDRAFT_8785 [Piloderma croceum F 1598]|uniref:Uncharacterized protein n=1 Tax=Piloderma croceum (strain F 1598) TaxID=765440 RepID=A0A0C3B5A1_PILCF|nr:hypothetical protein PILCRDRAFT_8785 [Piloderma croceum F 1598]
MDINLDTPMLNADSTLKEAAEIEWDHFPMQVPKSFPSKKANNNQNGKVGTTKLKLAAVECVKSINALHSKATTVDDPELDDDEVALQQPKKK